MFHWVSLFQLLVCCWQSGCGLSHNRTLFLGWLPWTIEENQHMHTSSEQQPTIWMKWRFILIEWAAIILIAYTYSAKALLDFNPLQLQQTGEQNESATRTLLAEISITRYGEIPLWNPFMQTGFPSAGDLLGHFWSPISTIPIMIWGGIDGMKVSVFIAFILAGLGQWYLGRLCGLRGIFRLWSSITFMVSGGLALLWRLGWYELLLGAVWFPWAFASFWSALHHRNRSSLVYCAICVAMILLTGGGYYPFYLLGTASVLLLIAYLTSKPNIRRRMLPRAIVIALLVAGLIAVMAFPIYDGYRLIFRESGVDAEQNGSQPVHYALMNYLISEPEWLNANILGTANGWNWFYLGPLSIGALLFLVPAFRYRRSRPILIAISALTVFMLLWVANRYPPVKYIYDWIKFLYQLRFPNRLLIIASSPLLILSAFSLQAIYYLIRKWSNRFSISLNNSNNAISLTLRFNNLISLGFLLVLFFSVRDTYKVNKSMAFGPILLDQKPFEALKWLKTFDSGLYYTDLGDGSLFWNWTPAAYELEMPIINFVYNQLLASRFQQTSDESPFSASPKYQFLQSNQTPLPDAQLVHDFDGYQLWYYSDALPFAFIAPNAALETSTKMDHSQVVPMEVSFDGPNRVKVVAEYAGTSDQLVVLVSDFPGWKLNVDGKPAIMTPVNYYLGTKPLPGKHTYTFIFDPPLYRIGLLITLYTIYIVLLIILSESLPFIKTIYYLHRR
jgi:hypothetical protein